VCRGTEPESNVDAVFHPAAHAVLQLHVGLDARVLGAELVEESPKDVLEGAPWADDAQWSIKANRRPRPRSINCLTATRMSVALHVSVLRRISSSISCSAPIRHDASAAAGGSVCCALRISLCLHRLRPVCRQSRSVRDHRQLGAERQQNARCTQRHDAKHHQPTTHARGSRPPVSNSSRRASSRRQDGNRVVGCLEGSTSSPRQSG
jgi:hypothetical protein